MIENFLRLNLKYLVPTEKKSNEILAKLKPGDTMMARVINSEEGRALLNIKGTEVLADTERALVKGETIRIKIQDVKNNRILVRVEEKEETESPKQEFSKATSKLKSAVIKESINLKIVISEKKMDKVVELYKQMKPQNLKDIDTKTIKTLLLMETNNLDFDDDLFSNLKSYIDKDFKEIIELNEKLAANLKKSISNMKNSDGEISKGLNLLNNLRELNGENIFEHMFYLGDSETPVELKVNYEKEEEKDKISSDQISTTIDIDMQTLGKLKINVNKSKKNLDVLIFSNNEVGKSLLKENSGDLISTLVGKGYSVGEIKFRNYLEEQEVEISEVNIKV